MGLFLSASWLPKLSNFTLTNAPVMMFCLSTAQRQRCQLPVDNISEISNPKLISYVVFSGVCHIKYRQYAHHHKYEGFHTSLRFSVRLKRIKLSLDSVLVREQCSFDLHGN